MRSAVIDRQVCENHKRYDNVEDAVAALHRLFGSARFNGHEPDKRMQVWRCVLWPLHWHLGTKRT